MALSKKAIHARKLFRDKYNTLTVQVLGLISKGWTTDRIVDKLDITVGTVSAIRANFTRGTYVPFVGLSPKTGKLVGECRF